MGKYYFQTPSPDLDAITKRLVLWFKQNEYDVDSTKDDHSYFIQAKKTGSLRTLTGTNVAFKITLSPSEDPNEFICDMATGKWAANLAGAGMTALFTGGLTLVTGAMGAAWVYKVERDIVEFMETTLKFRKIKTEGEVPGGAPATASAPASSAAPPPIPATPAPPPVSVALSPKEQAAARVASETAKIDEALRAGILNEAECNAKKQQVLANAFEYEVAFTVELRSAKLKEAVASGVLSQAECDAKTAQLAESIRAEVHRGQAAAKRADQLAKLQAAKNAGILSEEEYAAKVAALG